MTASPSVSSPQALQDQPLVSILMSTFNRVESLVGAIRSIKKQTCKNWELLLVNDGGEDVQKVVKGFFDKRISLITLPENRGKSHAINVAFAQSGGKYIAYLDDDDAWMPHHLQTHLDVLENSPDIPFTYSNTHKVTVERDRNRGDAEIRREQIYDRQIAFPDLIKRNEITWLSVVHRRECYEAVGGMDERLNALVDFDLWRRMAAIYAFHHIPQHTGDYFFRTEKGAELKQITGRMESDPAAYLLNYVLITRKRCAPELEAQYADKFREARQAAAVDFLIARARAFKAQGRYARSKISLQQAVKRDSGVAATRELGWLEFENGQLAPALACFEKCIATDPCESDYFFAAKLCMLQKRARRAVDLLEKLKSTSSLSGQSLALYTEYMAEAQALMT